MGFVGFVVGGMNGWGGEGAEVVEPGVEVLLEGVDLVVEGLDG